MDLYQMAQSNDPTFQSARFTYDAARQKRMEALSALLPAVAATADGNQTRGSTKYTDTPQVTRSFYGDDWAVQLTQPVFRAANVFAFEESKAVVDQAASEYAAAEQDLIVRVAEATFDVLVAEETLEAAEAQLRSMEVQLSAAEDSYRRGVATVTDADDARSRRALAQAQSNAAVTGLEIKRATLEAITGPLSSDLAALRAGVVLRTPIPDDLATWLTQSREENPGVRASEANVAAAEHELSRVRALRLPTVDLVASYGGNYSNGNIVNPVNYGSEVRDRNVALQFSMPLFQGGNLEAQIHEAYAKWQKAVADLELARRQAALLVKTSFATIHSDLAQVAALREAVEAGARTVKGAQAGYGLGIRINSDVLNAEQQLYGSQRDLAQARYDTLLEGLKLKAAVGDLRPSDLQAVDALLSSSSASTPGN